MPRRLAKIATIRDGIFHEFKPTDDIPDDHLLFRYFYVDTKTGKPTPEMGEFTGAV